MTARERRTNPDHRSQSNPTDCTWPEPGNKSAKRLTNLGDKFWSKSNFMRPPPHGPLPLRGKAKQAWMSSCVR